MDLLHNLALGFSVPVSYTHLDVYKRQAPTLGQHTREVLAEYLKMPEEEIETMLKEQKELVHT